MSQLIFPPNPSYGDTYTGDNGIVYTFDGVKWNGGTVLGVISTATFSDDILPTLDLTYNLGSPEKQWRSLYVGTGTIYIGGIPITVNQTNNTLVVGLEPGQEHTTSTNVATESYVIEYVAQHGGANLEIDGGDASTIYTAEIEIDGGGA